VVGARKRVLVATPKAAPGVPYTTSVRAALDIGTEAVLGVLYILLTAPGIAMGAAVKVLYTALGFGAEASAAVDVGLDAAMGIPYTLLELGTEETAVHTALEAVAEKPCSILLLAAEVSTAPIPRRSDPCELELCAQILAAEASAKASIVPYLPSVHDGDVGVEVPSSASLVQFARHRHPQLYHRGQPRCRCCARPRDPRLLCLCTLC